MMKKTAVIYWSGTGNTESMANAVCEGMKSAGAEAVLLTPSEANASLLSGLDAIAFGCPAMGSEVLAVTLYPLDVDQKVKVSADGVARLVM